MPRKYDKHTRGTYNIANSAFIISYAQGGTYVRVQQHAVVLDLQKKALTFANKITTPLRNSAREEGRIALCFCMVHSRQQSIHIL